MSKAGNYIGHGTQTNGVFDKGCVYIYKGKTYTEADLMKPIVKACNAYLRGSGVKVITDYGTNNINMIMQVKKSNSNNVDVHVAWHCDYSKAPKGTLPLYVSAEGKKLAAQMNKYVLKYSTLSTRGLCRRTDLYELNQTDMPAVIFEVGSIKADLERMRTEADAIGKGGAKGICAYLGVKFTGKKA